MHHSIKKAILSTIRAQTLHLLCAGALILFGTPSASSSTPSSFYVGIGLRIGYQIQEGLTLGGLISLGGFISSDLGIMNITIGLDPLVAGDGVFINAYAEAQQHFAIANVSGPITLLPMLWGYGLGVSFLEIRNETVSFSGIRPRASLYCGQLILEVSVAGNFLMPSELLLQSFSFSGLAQLPIGLDHRPNPEY